MKKYQLNDCDGLDFNPEFITYKEIFKEANSQMKVEVFSPRENIIHFNKSIHKLYFLIKGKAKIYMLHEDGKRSLIQFLKAGDFIGELTLLDIEKQHKDVIAISDCTCLTVPMDTARNVLLQDVEFLNYLNKYLGEKLLRRTEFFAKNLNYELKNRLAAYILLTENEGIYCEKHTETAEFLGISYRHLLYTLKQFQEDKMLIKHDKGYLIDYDKLQGLGKDI